MPRRDLEAELSRLSQLREEAPETQRAALSAGLRDKANVIVARAARVAADCGVFALIPDLCTAFDRLFRNPVKSDPQCWGKIAVAKALKELAHAESATFLRGIGFVQMEPVWGGSADTAGSLRATCALALVQCRDIAQEQIICHLIDALADTDPTVRADAIRGLLHLGGSEITHLLRLKAHVGDEDPLVTGLSLESVLALEGEGALAWTARFLSAAEPVCEEAALAMGASRLPGAVDLLIEHYQAAPRSRPYVLRALGLSRNQKAISYLFDLLASVPAREAAFISECLAPAAGAPEVAAKLNQIRRARGDFD